MEEKDILDLFSVVLLVILLYFICPEEYRHFVIKFLIILIVPMIILPLMICIKNKIFERKERKK